MSINPWNMLFHAINAIILIIAFRYYLYKPVRKFMDSRAERIKSEREEAEAAKRSASEHEARAQAELDNALIQATKTLQESHARCDIEAAELIKQANAEAARIIEEAKARAEDMVARSREESRVEVVELAVLIAEKVLAREVSKADNQKMIDQFLAEVR